MTFILSSLPLYYIVFSLNLPAIGGGGTRRHPPGRLRDFGAPVCLRLDGDLSQNPLGVYLVTNTKFTSFLRHCNYSRTN